MLARFGVLCSWLGTGIAVLLLGAALFLPITGSGNREDYILARVLVLVLPAAVALLIGWGIRYVFTGPRKR